MPLFRVIRQLILAPVGGQAGCDPWPTGPKQSNTRESGMEAGREGGHTQTPPKEFRNGSPLRFGAAQRVSRPAHAWSAPAGTILFKGRKGAMRAMRARSCVWSRDCGEKNFRKKRKLLELLEAPPALLIR